MSPQIAAADFEFETTAPQMAISNSLLNFLVSCSVNHQSYLHTFFFLLDFLSSLPTLLFPHSLLLPSISPPTTFLPHFLLNRRLDFPLFAVAAFENFPLRRLAFLAFRAINHSKFLLLRLDYKFNSTPPPLRIKKK